MDVDKPGERPCPAESATGPMGTFPHGSSVMIWPCPSVPYDLRFPPSNFGVRPGQHRRGGFSCPANTGGNPTGWACSVGVETVLVHSSRTIIPHGRTNFILPQGEVRVRDRNT